MGRKEKFTAEQVANALRETKGMTTLAARRLGCDFVTIQRYINKYPTVEAVRKEAFEQMGDTAELTLYNLAVTEQNVTALIFLLKTRFRERGYIEKIIIEGGVPIDLINETIRALAGANMSASDIFHELIREAADQQRVSPSGDSADPAP